MNPSFGLQSDKASVSAFLEENAAFTGECNRRVGLVLLSLVLRLGLDSIGVWVAYFHSSAVILNHFSGVSI